MAESGGSKFFKYGCFGCLGLVAVLILAAGAVSGVAWLRAKNVEFSKTNATYEETATPVSTEAAADEPAPGAPGRVTLKIDSAEEVQLVPCEEGRGVSVDADYNPKRFELREAMETDEDGLWHYTVEMRGRGSGLMRALEKVFSGRGSRFEICLPRDAEIGLDAEIADGGLEAELGGLWLSLLDVTLERGGIEASFREPLKEPIDAIRLRATMGGGALMNVGNASPAAVDVQYSMGGMVIDFNGAWAGDSTLSFEGSMGGISLIVPRDLALDGAPVEGSDREGAYRLIFAPGTDFESIDISRR